MDESVAKFFNKSSEQYISIFRSILNIANKGLSGEDFLKEISILFFDFCHCETIEIRLIRQDSLIQSEMLSLENGNHEFESKSFKRNGGEILSLKLSNISDLEQLYNDIALGRFDISLPYYTNNGSFWLGDATQPLELSSETCKWAGGRTIFLKGDFLSIVIIRFMIEKNNYGLLILKSKEKNYFSIDNVKAIEGIAHVLGAAFTHRTTQVELRERVKELACLYKIANVASKPGISLDQILEETVEVIPPGWLYPQIAAARIMFDGKTYITKGFDENLQRISADIVVDGEIRGIVDVAYTKEMPDLFEGPFLKEERNLINAIAHDLALIIDRRQSAEEREQLLDQLRHADRLATIGQLSAGVAHEINEPLGNILGFAQLIKKNQEMPDQIRSDIEKIEAASLHAREVIKKLMIFARQSSQKKTNINLNSVIEEGLYFLESRCAKAGIELVREFERDLPDIEADINQLHQVLINLMVNAIQAIPYKGKITIKTARDDNGVMLSVSDNGIGISQEIIGKIFDPFFTTKEIGEGTGLGLAVVHGIIAAHQGTIRVASENGRGTCFDISLPCVKI